MIFLQIFDIERSKGL